MKKSFLLALTLLTFATVNAQEVRVGCIGFYNLENLFDTIDAPDIRDAEFTPKGDRLWNTTLYQEKLGNLAKVIKEIGTDLTPDGVAILGVAEVENRSVLEDLVKHPTLIDRKYKIIHFDSPDERGIDVGLLYQPKYFRLDTAFAIEQPIPEPDGDIDRTRDVLYVSGKFDKDPMHFLVNHWPSRSGGEAVSSWKREGSAAINKAIVDSLMMTNPKAKVIIMGDLNDDPISPSVKKVLNAKHKKSKLQSKDLYNPMYSFFQKGIGTLAWRDSWNLFDQLIISEGLVNPAGQSYEFYKANVHNKKYLQNKSGRYKGYPFRTFAGDNYIGGYSDHFPVYLYLIKRM